MRRRPPPDLAVVAGLAMVGALAALLPLHGWLQAVLIGPLVLALPGYALAAALFPPGTLSRGERLVHTFVLSIAAVAIGGVILQLVFDLHHTVILLLELAVTLGGVAVALRRRAMRPSRATALPPPGPAPGIVVLLGYAAALVIAVGAVTTDASGVRDQQDRQVFASLWAVPDKQDPSLVRVGVWNHGGPSSLELQVSSAETLLATIPVELDEDPRWETTLPPEVDAAAPDLTLTLFDAGVPYRSVELNIGEAE